MIAVLQIRGDIDARQGVKDTLKMLHLGRKMSCVLVDPENDSMMGMVRKVKDFVTYGPVSADTKKALEKLMDENGRARLHPPRGGMKSVKRTVRQGGDLGQREELDSLLTRMMPEGVTIAKAKPAAKPAEKEDKK